MAKRVKPWRDASIIAPADRERSHCVMCDEPTPSVMCEMTHGVCVAFYHYCPVHWYAPAANGGPSAARRTGVDVPIAELLEQVADYERRWLAECRAHGETQRKLMLAHHELGDHSLCSDCDATDEDL